MENRFLAEWGSRFPNLNPSDFKITSDNTKIYNCIAWAAHANDVWWDPAPGYYWPEGVERTYSVDILINVYQKHGYSKCQDGKHEAGFEKIAIYGMNGIYTHAARQLEDGKWTSKLGELHDIQHESVECLEGEKSMCYGRSILFMKRGK
jgi:hypothetical protein